MREAPFTLGRYEIVASLGKGGVGQVFRAKDPSLQRVVAIKLLKDDDVEPAEREEMRARFLREARAAASVRHPNVVTVFDVGEDGDTPYMIMELVEGRTLRASVPDETVPLEQRLRWLVDIAKGLAAAHALGLVHRDVKPENVIIAESGDPKILDFGLAKPFIPRPGLTFETLDDRVLGTPKYMSPEQIVGAPLDARTDQFAWGRMAFEVLSRSFARPGRRMPRLDEVMPSAPKRLVDLVERTQAPLPSNRHQDMNAVVAELEEILDSLDATETKGEIPRRVTPHAAHPPPREATSRAETKAQPPKAEGSGRRVFLLAAAAPIAIVGVLALGVYLGASRAPNVTTPPMPSAATAASSASQRSLVDVSASASASVLPAPSLSTSSPVQAAPPPPRASSAAAAGPSCVCREQRLGRFFGPTCLTAQTPVCRCYSIEHSGALLCPAPPDSAGECAQRDRRLPNARTEDACTGFLRFPSGVVEGGKGRLECSLCEVPDRRTGMKDGAPCQGYVRGDSTRVDGVWDCRAD
ncbi:MAG: serine/threonine protein kinase [Deltaproteobacteria bacterium]|nr:serine/threonine protein kinase [Deltaproteobacteria bacterium]